MDARTELHLIIAHAEAALAALDDEHEGNFRLHLNAAATGASTLANEVAGW